MITKPTKAANKITSVKRKKTENIRLFMPLFFDDEKALSSGKLDVDISPILNGSCLCGDDAKRDGLFDAYAYAKKNKKIVRVLDVNVTLSGVGQGHHRPDEKELLSGKFGMVKFERHSTKLELSNILSDLIIQRAKSLHPNLRKRTADEWLQLDPSLARVLFEDYPISVVVVNSRVPYSKQILSVAIIRDQDWRDRISAGLYFIKNIKVNLVETDKPD